MKREVGKIIVEGNCPWCNKKIIADKPSGTNVIRIGRVMTSTEVTKELDLKAQLKV